MYNVTQKQINKAIESIFEILQLEPDLSNSFEIMLINWLDVNDIEVIEK
jgi:hypothetical protein